MENLLLLLLFSYNVFSQPNPTIQQLISQLQSVNDCTRLFIYLFIQILKKCCFSSEKACWFMPKGCEESDIQELV